MILYIMCGAPGSGKTYFAKNHLMKNDENLYYVSRDEVRYSIITDEDEYFSKENEVFQMFINKIKYYLNSKTFACSGVIADATHLNWPSRRKLLNALGILNGAYPNLEIIPVVVRPDLDVVLERNNQREGRARVPKDTVIHMRNSQISPWKDPFKYTAVMEVRA